MRDDRLRALIDVRHSGQHGITQLAAARRQPATLLDDRGRLMIIALDHPARGALRAGHRALAMADRADRLDRLCVALSRSTPPSACSSQSTPVDGGTWS